MFVHRESLAGKDEEKGPDGEAAGPGGPQGAAGGGAGGMGGTTVGGKYVPPSRRGEGARDRVQGDSMPDRRRSKYFTTRFVTRSFDSSSDQFIAK